MLKHDWMRRNVLVLLLVVGSVSIGSYLRRGHVATAHGISPLMSSAEIESRLGAPQQRKRTIKNPVDWDYPDLHLGVDFVLMDQGIQRAHYVYSQCLELDGQVIESGTGVESIVRVLGEPEIRTADRLRFQVLTGTLDVFVDRRTQLTEEFRLRER